MRTSTVLISALAAAVHAAPTYPQLNMDAAMPNGLEVMSEYFNMLAEKVQANKYMSSAPTCDLARAVMPAGAEGLPKPAAGLVLRHVAIGRGTQNYTCDVTNTTAVPQAAGAVATLFNASCVAAAYPDLLNILPKVSMQFNLTTEENPRMGPSNLAISGKHFFSNNTTPIFNLDTPEQQIGVAGFQRNSSVPAPTGAPVGQGGEAAVAWLRLLSRDGATGGLREVYRLDTAGGSAPASCKGMPANFEVQYSAAYWFYGTPDKS